MAKYIAISFTLGAGQSLSEITPFLERIKKENPDAILVHGFMSREAVEARGFSTAVVDKLDELFPEQKRFWNDEKETVDRDGMKAFVYDNQADVYVIGSITGGVKDETIAYIRAGIQPTFYKLTDGIPVADGESNTEATLATPVHKLRNSVAYMPVDSVAEKVHERYLRLASPEAKENGKFPNGASQNRPWNELNEEEKGYVKQMVNSVYGAIDEIFNKPQNISDMPTEQNPPVNPTNPNALENQGTNKGTIEEKLDTNAVQGSADTVTPSVVTTANPATNEEESKKEEGNEETPATSSDESAL